LLAFIEAFKRSNAAVIQRAKDLLRSQSIVMGFPIRVYIWQAWNKTIGEIPKLFPCILFGFRGVQANQPSYKNGCSPALKEKCLLTILRKKNVFDTFF